MSVWQWNAACGGYAKANSNPEDQGLSTDEAQQLAALIDEPAVWH